MRLLVSLMPPLMLLLTLTGCGNGAPTTEPAPAAPAATPAPATGGVADRVPSDHVLQPQLQTLDKARGVQDLANQAKVRVDDATDQQQP